MKRRVVLIVLLSSLALALPTYFTLISAKDDVKKVVVVKKNAFACSALDSYVELRTTNSTGSGVVILLDGVKYILTAGHVAEGETELTAYKRTKTRGISWRCKVVKISADADLALLSIEESEDLIPIKLADEEPEVGEDLYSVGTPHHLHAVFDKTLVSKMRHVEENGREYMMTMGMQWFGSSGGPFYTRCLTDGCYKLVGITSRLVGQYGSTNTARSPTLCVPLDEIKKFLKSINTTASSSKTGIASAK